MILLDTQSYAFLLTHRRPFRNIRTNNGTGFTAGSGTVTFNGNNNTQTFSGSSSFNNLTINHTGTGSVTATGSTLTVSTLLRVQAGTFTSSSTYKDVQIDAGATLASDGGTISVSGNWTNNGGTFTPAAGTVTFNSTTGAQTIGGTAASQTFNNLIVDKSGQTLSVGGSTATLTLNGTLTLTAGTFSAGTATNINVGGDWTNNGGSFTPGSGTVTFTGTTGAQAINGSAASQTFNNITVTKTAQTLSIGGITTTVTVNGNLTVTSGIVDPASNLFTGSGTNTLSVTGTIKVDASTFAGNYASFETRTLNAGSTVDYDGGGAQTVDNTLSYRILVHSGSGTGTPGGNLTIAENLTVSGGTLDLSTFTANRGSAGGTLTLGAGATLKIGGTGTLPSNYTAHSVSSTSTIEYEGSTQSVATLNSAQNYGTLIISGSSTKTLAGAITVAGNLTINSSILDLSTFTANRSAGGGILTVANGAALKIGGTNGFPTNYTTHTLGTSSTVEYGGTNQSVSAETYGHLTTSGTLTKTLAGTITVSGNLTIGSGTTLAAGANNIGIGGNWANSGSFTAGTGTVTFNGDNITQTLSGTNTFNNLTINHTGTGSVTASSSTLTVSTLLRVQAGTFTSSSTFKDVQIDAGATLESDGGTMSVSGNWTNNGGTFTPGSGTVTFTSTTAGQSINGSAASQTFNNLTVSKSGQILSVGGSTTSLTINANLTVSAGTFDPVTGLITGSGANTLDVTGTIRVDAATFSGNYASFETRTLNAGSTVDYDGSGAQTVDNTLSYKNLVHSGSGTGTPDGNLTIAENLTVSGGTLDLGGFTADRTTGGGGTLTVGAGATLKIGGTNTFPDNYTTNTLSGTVEYSGSTQSVSVKSYTNLTISGSSTKTLAGTITPTGNLTVNSSTLDLSTFTANHSGAGNTLTVANGATLKIGGTNTFPSNYTTHTLGTSSTVNYSGTAQDVSLDNYGNLTTSGSATKSLSGNTTVNGDVTIGSGTTLDAQVTNKNWNLSVGGSWANDGSFTAGTGTVTFTGTGTKTISGGATTAFNKITLNMGSSASILDVTSPITMAVSAGAPTLTLTTGTFRLSSISTITPFGGSVTFGSNVGYHMNNASAVSNWGSAGSLTLNGLLKIDAGTMTVGSGASDELFITASTGKDSLTGGTLKVAGRVRVTSSGQLTITGGELIVPTVSHSDNTYATFNMATDGALTMSGGTVTFERANAGTARDLFIASGSGAKSITGGTFQFGNANTSGSPVFKINSNVAIYNLTINGTGTPTARLDVNPLTVSNNVTIASGGTLDAATNNLNLSIGGNWTNNGTFSPGTATVTLNGTSGAQLMSGSTFYNLTINNAAGITLLTNERIDSTLRFISGKITTGIDTVIIGPTGTTAGAAAGKYVFGNERKIFTTGAQAFRFDVGDASRYAPDSIAFASVTTGGNVTSSTTSGEHPNISASGIDGTKDVNRYWTLTNAGVVFTTYNATFKFNNPDDLDGGATTSNFIVAKKDGSTWTLPSVGTKTTTSTQATGMSSMSDFAVGEPFVCTPPACSISGPDPVCYSSTNTYSGPAGVSAYAWTVSGSGTLQGSSTGSSISVAAGASGSYTVSLTTTSTSSASCTSTCTKVVNVTAAPVCSISGLDPVCFNSTNTYTGPAGVSYAWSVSGNGTISGSSTGSSISVAAEASGSYTVSLTTTTTSGASCSSSCQKLVSITPAPACTIDGPATVCSSTTNTYSGPAGVSYQWQVSGSGTLLSSSTGSSVSVAAGASGSYTVSLTTTTTSGATCLSSCEEAVTVTPAPACTIDGPATVCFSTTNTYSGPAGVSYAWLVSGNGTLQGSSTGSSISVAAGGSGSYTVSLTTTTTSGTTCSSSCQEVVTVTPQPACSISGPDPVCFSTTNTYSGPAGAGLSYSWSVSGDGTISGSSTGSSITVNAGATGSYTVHLTTTAGPSCTSTCEQVVTITPQPACSISGPDPVCFSTTNTYSGPAGVSYAWSVSGDGTISGSSTGSSITVNAGATGSYTVHLTTSAGPGCTSTCEQVVTITPQPACSISGPDPVCFSTTNTYTGPAGAGLSYSWSVTGDGTISGSSTGSSVVVNAGATGSYTVHLTTTVGSGCSNECVFPVTITPQPACSISGPDPVCFNSTNTYSGPAGVNYAWAVSGGGTISGSSTGSSVVVNAGATGSYTVHLTTTVGSGCSNTCNFPVTITPQPACTIDGPATVCFSTTNTYTGPAGAGLSYAWSVSGDGTINGSSTGSSVVVNAGATGSYTVHLTTTVGSGCSNTCSFPVTITAQPACSISGPDPVCFSTTNTYTGPAGAGLSYAWSVSGDGTISGSSTGSSVVVNAGATGSYTVHLTTTVGSGCSNTCNFPVTITAQPACSISGPDPVCFSTTNTYTGPAGAGLSYAWSVSGDGTISGSSTGSSVVVNAGATGSYTVHLTTTVGSGCTNTCNFPVTITAQPACSISGPDPVCFSTTNTYTGPAGAGLSYAWSVSGDGTISGSSTGSSISVNAGASGSYTVHLTTTVGTGCANTCSLPVTVTPQPACTIDGPATVCFNATNTYSGPAGVNYEWSVSGNGTLSGSSTGSSISVNAGASGSYTVHLTTTVGTGCANTCSVPVTVTPQPACSISGPDVVCFNATNTYSGPAAVNYAWSVSGNGTLSGSSTGSSISVNAGATGSYTVHLTTTVGSGCSNTCNFPVTITAQPACSISGPDPVCFSTTNTYTGPAGAGLSYAWSVSGDGTINGSSTGSSVVVNAGATGSYTVHLTTTVGSGCSNTCNFPVTITPQPACSISGPDPVCFSTTNTYTGPAGAGLSYAWSVSGAGTINGSSTGSSITVNAGATGSYTVHLTTTVGTGCSNTCVFPVTITPQPACSISGPDVVCFNLTTSYSGPAGVSYAWSVSGSGTISGSSTGSSISVNAGASASYTVHLTTTVGSGCTNVCEEVVTVTPQPACTIDGPATVCFSATNTYTGPAGAGLSYAWSVSGSGTISGSSTGSSISVNAGASGSYTVHLTTTVGSGCTNVCEEVVTVTPQPACTIDGPATVCFSATNTYSGPAGVNYAWAVSGGGTLLGSSTGSSISVAAGASGSYTMSLTTTTTSGASCSSSCQKVANITPQPTCSVSGPDPVCFSSTNTYSGPAGVSYAWSVSGNGTLTGSSTGSSITVSAEPSGSYTISLTTTVGSNCTSTCTKSVTITAQPACTITGPSPVCFSSTNTYSGPAGVSYAWSVSGNGTLSGSSTGSSVAVVAGASGSYTVSLTTTVGSGCTNTCNFPVTITPQPVCSIDGPATVCFSSTSSYSGPGGVDSYAWLVIGNGTINGSSTGSSVVVNAGATGSYTVHLTTAVGSGCSNTCNFPVTITAQPACTITGPATVCFSTTNAYSGPAGVSYAWSVSGNGTLTGSSTGSSITVSAEASGSYTISLTTTVGIGCTSTCPKPVTITPQPTCSITGPSPVCFNSSNTYNGPGGVDTYAWSVSGNGTLSGSSTGSSITVNAGVSGSYTVSLTTKAGPGCANTCSATATIINPSCTISGPNPVIYATSNTYTATSGPGATFTWAISGNGTIIGASTGSSVNVEAGNIGSFTVTVTSTIGSCTTTCTKAVTVNPACSQPVAETYYVGPKFYWTTNATSSTATMTLIATLKNKCTDFGDIRTAKVTFCVRNGTTLTLIKGAQNLPVGLVNPDDKNVGTASVNVQYDIGKLTATILDIAVVVSGNYTADDPATDCPIMVAVPVPGGQICGGGTIGNGNSAGYIKGASGMSTDFAFFVQYNKTLKNPQGGVEIMVDSYYDHNGNYDGTKLRTYKLKSTAISVLAVSSPTAQFSSKANVSEIVDGVEQGIEGNCIMQLEMFDGATKSGTPPDSLAVTVYRKAGGIWFSSNWDGTKTSLKVIGGGGNVSVTGGGSASMGGGETALQLEADFIPKEYALYQNYPNPFNPTTQIQFDLPEVSRVRVVLYDILGREVMTLVEGELEAGRYHRLWDGRDHYGKFLASGVYFFRIDASSLTSDRKLVTLRKMMMLK